MIRAAFRLGPDGALRALRVDGHSGLFAAGRDPLCAAVSVLVSATFASLSRDWGINAAPLETGPGRFAAELPDLRGTTNYPPACALLFNLQHALADLARRYPDGLTVTTEEG